MSDKRNELNMPEETIHISPPYQSLLSAAGFNGEFVFASPEIKPWRTLDGRENCTWDVAGRRLHVKRYTSRSSVDAEAAGYRLLEEAKIPTVNVVAWGHLPGSRSFLITEDLAGFSPADKLLKTGVPFNLLLNPTADLAATLHLAGLHHRDLYLCHFFAKIENEQVHLRLIDAARVKPLPSWLFRPRWIAKDLAQFWFSTLEHAITDDQRSAWLIRYGERSRLESITGLQKAIEKKVAQIASHDRNLRKDQPTRNISIPGGVSS
jgi:hypothetical protein